MVFEDARARLGETTSDKKKYAKLLKGLILQVRPGPVSHFSRPTFPLLLWLSSLPSHPHLPPFIARRTYRGPQLTPTSQSLYTMMEKDITVSGRPKDAAVLKAATAAAAIEFEKEAGFPIKLVVDEELAAGRSALSSSSSFSCRTSWLMQCSVRVESRSRGTGTGSS